MLQFQRTKGLFPKIEGEADPCKDSVPISQQIKIKDHAEETTIERSVRGCVNHILEDTRGVNKPINSKTAPATNGMCPKCTVKSVRCKNNKSACYVCAITHLPLRADCRYI